MTDLLFSSARSGNNDLVFGADAVTPPATLEITAGFAPLGVAIAIVPVEEVTITAGFAPMTVSMSADYASNTARPLVNNVDSPWQEAGLSESGIEQEHQDATATPSGFGIPFQDATPLSERIQHVQAGALARMSLAIAGVFQDGTRSHTDARFVYEEATRTSLLRKSSFQDGSKLRHSKLFRHQDGTRIHNSRKTKYQEGTRFALSRHGGFQVATPFIKGWLTRFQDAQVPRIGIHNLPVPPVPPVRIPDLDIVFDKFRTNDLHLVFSDPAGIPPIGSETIVVPVKRVYMVANNITLRRVSDDALIHANAIGLSLDADAWTWTWNASLPGTTLALVEPDGNGPIEVKLTINGTEFRLLVESLSRERVFGKTSIRVSGRGRNAVLDAPYAPIQTFTNTIERSANQLMEDVLTINNIPMGWNIDWQIADWLVPAGVFNHQGTYISALSAIAKAAGGLILPATSAQSFRIVHTYQTAPWDWPTAIPDFVLPADITSREGLEWSEKPEYNRVYVSGQGQGVLGQITREGTAGDVLAPMVTDQLITAAMAARQRGLAILGDTGRQIRVGLRMPVLDSTGIILPGVLVQYDDTRRGMVRSVSVDGKLPDVWQTLEIETHV